MKTKRLYFGAAYYDEYMPVSRVDEDMRLMRDAGMNVIRIAESTWSTWEPRDGVFDFTSLHRVLDAARKYGISVIIGTPTYAIPPWIARKYPDILAETHSGLSLYGHRQNMDITHPGYRFHCERIIRRIMEEVRSCDHVIGFQLDNETKHYDTCSQRAQALFKQWLIDKFETVENMNQAFGLAYWSNSLGCWDDLPDVRGTICGSLAAEYEAFQRQLVTDFLLWRYSHSAYAPYAAATCRRYGIGSAVYIGVMLENSILDDLMAAVLPEMGVTFPEQRWPLVIKEGINDYEDRIRYVFNFSEERKTVSIQEDACELLSDKLYRPGERYELEPWGVAILRGLRWV